MSTPAHPFVSRPSAARTIEKSTFWIFRIATYIILFAGLAVFGDIVVKGSSAVFGSFKETDRFPYFTNTFLAEAPESLYVFEHEGMKREMGDREYRAFREKETAAAAAAGRPAPKFKAESYVYSAGGIWPCIVGTVLLVVGSMTIALTLGVSSAVFLSEYAKDGPFVRFVRLAILNVLAG